MALRFIAREIGNWGSTWTWNCKLLFTWRTGNLEIMTLFKLCPFMKIPQPEEGAKHIQSSSFVLR